MPMEEILRDRLHVEADKNLRRKTMIREMQGKINVLEAEVEAKKRVIDRLYQELRRRRKDD